MLVRVNLSSIHALVDAIVNFQTNPTYTHLLAFAFEFSTCHYGSWFVWLQSRPVRVTGVSAVSLRMVCVCRSCNEDVRGHHAPATPEDPRDAMIRQLQGPQSHAVPPKQLTYIGRSSYLITLLLGDLCRALAILP